MHGYGTSVIVAFRAGLSGSCVLPRRPLPPSRVLCLPPVFFNTTLPTSLLATRAVAVLTAVACAQRITAGTWLLGVFGSEQRSAGRVASGRPEVHRRAHQVSRSVTGHRVDRGPVPMRTASRVSSGLRRARDVYVRAPYMAMLIDVHRA